MRPRPATDSEDHALSGSESEVTVTVQGRRAVVAIAGDQ
jgi:hypothetical protein